MKLNPLSASLIVVSTLAVSGFATAQSSDNVVAAELFPPNAKPGHCYARALIPATYQDSTEQVLVSEASESIAVIPAKFETGSETVLVREASTRIETVPATYKTLSEEIVDKPETVHLVAVPATYKDVTEQLLVKQASTRIETVPAEYGTETEQLLDKAAHTIWKKGSGFSGSAIETSVDQSTGEIMCLVDVPASYKTITRRVLLKPAATNEVAIPAEYAAVTRVVVDTPATTREEIIPATYKTVTRQIIDQPATSHVIEIPAEYKEVNVVKQVSAPDEVRTAIPASYDTVTKRSKVTSEELVWREVLCDVNLTGNVVSQLQSKLKEAGHYSDVVDGVWGGGTQRAINSFSVANGLPSGTNYIPMETADALGIEL